MAGRIPQDVINRVMEASDIVKVVEQYVQLDKKSSSNFFGLCPFHSEKTPSFSVSPGKQMFYCFGCHKGGNVFKFLEEIEHLSFPEAVERLAKEAGIEIPREDQEEYEKRQQRRYTQKAIAKEAARYFYHTLQGKSGRQAKAYMAERGFSEKTLIRFGIGFADDSWDGLAQWLFQKGFKEAEMIESGLVKKSSRGTLIDLFRNRVMFPIFEGSRDVIAFGGRVMDGSMPKYINSPENPIYHKGRHLFGWNLVMRAPDRKKRVILAEGYLDVMAMHQAGFDTAVASLGTALTPSQANMLSRRTDKIIVAYDGDSAGQNAALRAADILDREDADYGIAVIPNGEDPDDYIKNHGAEYFADILDKALPGIEFRLLVAEQRSKDRDGNLDRLTYQKAALEVLQRERNPIVRELYAQKIAEKIKVKPETILLLVNPDSGSAGNRGQEADFSAHSVIEKYEWERRAEQRGDDRPLPDAPPEESESHPQEEKLRLSRDEIDFLVALTENTNIFRNDTFRPRVEDFEGAAAQDLAKKVFAEVRRAEVATDDKETVRISPAMILSMMESSGTMSEEQREKFMRGVMQDRKISPFKLAMYSLLRMRLKRYERESKRIQYKLRDSATSDERRALILQKEDKQAKIQKIKRLLQQ